MVFMPSNRQYSGRMVVSINRGKLIKIILIVIVALLLIPHRYGVDDGGSYGYEAVLWQLEKHHSMWTEEEVFGYKNGTIFSIFWIEVYNDVVFVPDGQ